MAYFDLDIFNTEHEKMCELYWEVDSEGNFTSKISEIAKKLSVKKSDVTKIVKASCVAYSPNIQCTVCKSPKEFSSRSEYQTFTATTNWECNYCIEERQLAIDEKKRKLLEESLSSARSTPLNTETIGFKNAAFLLALVRYSANEDLTQIQALSTNQTDLLSPEFDFDFKIVKDLYHSGIIAVSPLSPLEAIELNEENGFSFYLNKVIWEVPLEKTDSLPSVINRIKKKFESMEYIDAEHESIKEVGKELCLVECLAYLTHVVEEHQLSFRVGEKTKLVLNSALENFSVAQVYNFIWRAGKDAAAFYLRSGVPRAHAANTIVRNIQKQYERALANNWEIKAFSRNYNMPQSIISQVIFNLLLKTDDGGFTQQIEKII